MPAFTIKDSGPTKTFTFDALQDYNYNLVSQRLSHIPFPEDGGQETISHGLWLEFYKFFFQLKDDTDWPATGESAADKWEDLRTWLKTGGDNDGVFTVTWNREDSKSGSETTYEFDGAIRLLHKKSIAGEHITIIDGDFELLINDPEE